MKTILQIEYSHSLAAIRTEILESLGNPIQSVVVSSDAVNRELENCSIGVIVIGHGAPLGRAT